jgi:hypothetical protein
MSPEEVFEIRLLQINKDEGSVTERDLGEFLLGS